MRRNATLSLDGFDPEVLDAAREVARRAGVPLETWLDSVVAGEPEVHGSSAPVPSVPIPAIPVPAVETPRARQQRPTPPAHASAPHSAHRETPREPVRQAVPSAPSPADAVGGAIAAMMQRLDALDRSIAEDRQAARQATAEAVGQIERRVSELSQQMTAPRPLGRRGRPLVAEVRDAVEEVRRRQEELDAPAAHDRTPASPTASPAPAEVPSPVVGELQRETRSLRDTIGGLATGHDVVALEQAMRALAAGIQRAKEPDDLAAIAAPIELMRVQVGRLADDVADNVHARLSGEVERVAARVDGALNGASASFAERDALDTLFRELDEIRRLVGALAGPERIQGLAQGLQSVSAQIAQLQTRLGGEGAGVAELKPLLEEIRVGMQTPDASRALLGRIEALADRMDRETINPVGDLLGRLEDLGETLRHPRPQDDGLASIHGLLHSLAEKVDRVGENQGSESLDGLEQQVTALASRLDARGADPSLVQVERTMHELLAQVSALRDESQIEVAVERATRHAIAQAVGDTGTAGDGGATIALRADLADLRERQAAADARMQATMENVHSALERLVGHLSGATAPAPAVRAPQPEDGRSVAERLRSSTAAPPVTPPATRELAAPLPRPSRTARRPELPKAGPAEAVRESDELLEPGAARPGPGQPVSADPALNPAAGGDIKTSFIAAARRAAQAAQADVAAEAPAAARRSDRVSRKIEGVTASSSPTGRGGRLRSEIEKRRRPLLLGLAAIVLALGALQAYQSMTAPTVGDVPTVVAATAPPATPSEPVPVADPAAAPAPAVPADPQTTQSIADAASAKARAIPPSSAPPAAPIAAPVPLGKPPRVTDMAGLSPDLAQVPGGLSKLKTSALDGDGTAVWELASREAEGRGMPRDLALAAKLYGKLAEAGYAPAQFKVGSFYEKGSGVVRDLGQAKTWYERAAAQGHVRSMHNLAVVHAENPIANGKPDFALAASWFRRAADYGVRDSQYNLAVLYARGLGLTQDLAQSYLWFAAAAAQGDEEAGRKRDDVGAKLAPKDLAAAKALVASFKPKVGDPAVNDGPKVASQPPMSLLGAPPPGSPPAPAPARIGQAGV